MKTGGKCSLRKDAEAGVVPEMCGVVQRESLQLRPEGGFRLTVEGLKGLGQRACAPSRGHRNRWREEV